MRLTNTSSDTQAPSRWTRRFEEGRARWESRPRETWASYPGSSGLKPDGGEMSAIRGGGGPTKRSILWSMLFLRCFAWIEIFSATKVLQINRSCCWRVVPGRPHTLLMGSYICSVCLEGDICRKSLNCTQPWSTNPIYKFFPKEVIKNIFKGCLLLRTTTIDYRRTISENKYPVI